MKEFTLTTAPTPEELAEWRSQLEQVAPDTKKAEATAYVGWAGEVTLDGNGNVKSFIDRSKGRKEAVAAGQLRPGHVIIPGVGETTVEAAINAGLLPQGWTPQQGFKQPVAGSNNLTAGERETPKSNETTPEDAIEDATFSAQKSAVEEAGKVLNTLDEAIGAEAVDSHVSEVVESGLIPDELPEGVDQTAVEKLVAGYVAAADATLADTGASVPILMETLSEAELREARSAAVNGDSLKLKHLGRVAMTRLEQLPQADPIGFSEMVEGMTPAERKMISKDEKSGQWVLRIPGQPPMSYGAAVRAGIIRV